MRSLDNKILKLLSNYDVTFFIPPYQRNYEWDEALCEIFYKDVEKVSNNENTQHFFGTVIYYAERNYLGEPNKYILVDGQQRLTTTMLFLIAARDVVNDFELKNIIDTKYLKNNNVSGDVEYKIKLKQVESDWDSYKKIILGEELQDEEKKTSVFKNYTFFKNKFSKLEEIEIKNLIENGLSNFNIVTIELEPQTNKWEKPQEIFESMNSLGKPLTLADLVRNYLLLGKNTNQQEELYNQYWKKIEENLRGDDNSFSISSFIRDYMQLIDVTSYKKATESNYKEIYRDFKSLFEDENHEELIKKLADYSTLYAVLAGYKDKESDKLRIKQKIADLRMLEASSFNSFILGVLHLFNEKEIDEQGCFDMLDAIFIYIARRRILRLTQSENKNAPLLVSFFDEIISSTDKKSKMLEILSNQQYALRLPNDNDIKTYLLSSESNFYNLRSGKFLQGLIEEYKTKTRPVLKDVQVEHIMPQTLNDIWRQELGENFQQIHDNYINSIGNLTITRHNSELSNKPFNEKKVYYRDNSGMQIAKDKIIDKEKWGEEEIKGRAEYLINIILNNILSIPDSLARSNNYSAERKVTKLSFEKLGLIGKNIYLIEKPEIFAKVVGNKELIFEEKKYRLSPLTKICMDRLGKTNVSRSYWGVDKWGYEGLSLFKLMQNTVDESDETEDENQED